MNCERLTLRINSKLKKELISLAKEQNKTINKLINELLEEAIILKITDEFDYYTIATKSDLKILKNELIKLIKEEVL